VIPKDTPSGLDNCGVAVVAMLGGVTYTEAESLFLLLCAKSDKTTVWDRLEVIDSLGLTSLQEKHYRFKPTLCSWISETLEPRYDYHLTLTGHVVGIRNGLLYDQVFRSGIQPLRSPYKRKQISHFQKLRPP
jgi:hypothetical protein